MTSSRADRRRHMARSSAIVMGAFVASKLVGLLRDRAIAHAFGASAEYDAYVAAFSVPDLLFTLFAGGALVSAFLPVFADALARDDAEGAWTTANGVTNTVFVVTALLAGAAALGAPALVGVLAPGFGAAQRALTADLMRIVLVSTMVFSLSGIQMGMLNAFQHFLLPAVAPIVYNLGILAGATFLAPTFGIRGLAYGVVLGAVGHLVVKLPALLRFGFRFQPVFGLDRPEVRQVFWLMWPRVLALGTVQAVLFVNTRLASELEAGSLSALRYAWNIAQMPQTILGTAIATVAFPTLAELAARGELGELRATVVGTLRVMIALSVPAAVGLWVLGGPAIAVLLRSGAFDEAAAAATLFALRMYALGLVAHVTLEVVARTFYAQKDTVTPLVVAAIAMTANVLLAYAFVGPLDHGGLALANSVAVVFEVLLALWWLGRRWNGAGGGELAMTLARTGLAGAAMAVVIGAALRLMPEPLPGLGGSPLLEGLARAAVGGTLGLAAYAVVGTALGLEELRGLRQFVRRGRAPG